MYSDEPVGMVRADSEYISIEVEDDKVKVNVGSFADVMRTVSTPVYTGGTAVLPIQHSTRLKEKDQSRFKQLVDSVKCKVTPKKQHKNLKENNSPETTTNDATAALHLGGGENRLPEEYEGDTNIDDAVDERQLERLGSVVELIGEGELGIDISKLIEGNYINDKLMGRIIAKPQHFKDFTL